MPQTCYIYTLHASNDPECRPRYVGFTVRLKRREAEHHFQKKGRKGEWIYSLREVGARAVLTVIHTFISDDSSEKAIIEAEWIEKYRASYPDLLNDMGGGEGVAKCSPWTLLKLSKAVKKVWENPEYRNKRDKSHYSDPDYRKKLSISKKKAVDPEFREKMSAEMKQRFNDPELRAKYKEVRKRISSTLEWREKRSALAKLQWQRPEHRAKFLATRALRVYKKKKV